MTESPPRYYCSDCPTPVGNCQCNWAERTSAKQAETLEALAETHPVDTAFAAWVDRALGQSYAYLKLLRRCDGDPKCISHLADVVHHLSELKEHPASEAIPF